MFSLDTGDKSDVRHLTTLSAGIGLPESVQDHGILWATRRRLVLRTRHFMAILTDGHSPLPYTSSLH